MGLSFKIAPGPPQRSHSQIRVLRLSRPHFTVSDSRHPQHGRPGPRIYVPQEQGGSVISPVTEFPSRRLLRLAELWWRYSTPPPQRSKSKSVILRLGVYCQSIRLGVKSLETTTRYFFQLNSCCNSPYVTSSLTRSCGCLL
jgi:hypothetical protein